MSRAGTSYGQALYSLAREECLCDAIFQQLQLLKKCLDAEPEYIKLLSCVALSKPERCLLVDDLEPFLHRYVLNFLKILIKKGKIHLWNDSFNAYRQQYCHDKGILPVTAITAFAMSPIQRQRLQEKLEFLTKKEIQLTFRADKTLLGGIRLEYDGNQLEDSIFKRLKHLEHFLKTPTL